jgi:hypothetical protein
LPPALSDLRGDPSNDRGGERSQAGGVEAHESQNKNRWKKFHRFRHGRGQKVPEKVPEAKKARLAIAGREAIEAGELPAGVEHAAPTGVESPLLLTPHAMRCLVRVLAAAVFATLLAGACSADDPAPRPVAETMKKKVEKDEIRKLPTIVMMREAAQLVADTGKPVELELPKGVRVAYGYSKKDHREAAGNMWAKKPSGALNLGWSNAKGKKGYWAIGLWADPRQVNYEDFR